MGQTSTTEILLKLFDLQNPRFHYKQIDEIEGYAIYESTQLPARDLSVPDDVKAKGGLVIFRLPILMVGALWIGYVASSSIFLFPLSPQEVDGEMLGLAIPLLVVALLFAVGGWTFTLSNNGKRRTLRLLDKEVKGTLLRIGIERSPGSDGGLFYRPVAWYRYVVDETAHELPVRRRSAISSFEGALHMNKKDPFGEEQTIYYFSEKPGEVATTSNTVGRPIFPTLFFLAGLYILMQLGAFSRLLWG